MRNLSQELTDLNAIVADYTLPTTTRIEELPYASVRMSHAQLSAAQRRIFALEGVIAAFAPTLTGEIQRLHSAVNDALQAVVFAKALFSF